MKQTGHENVALVSCLFLPRKLVWHEAHAQARFIYMNVLEQNHTEIDSLAYACAKISMAV